MKIYIIFYTLLAGLLLTGCSDMNSLHQEYIDRGEAIYTGVVDSLKAYPGMYRARFEWMLQADPRITKVEITWRERGTQKAAEVAVNRTENGAFHMEHILENLPEGAISFEFVTRDAEGHRSLSASNTTTVLGSDYEQNLQPRKATALKFLYDVNDYSIAWGSIDSKLTRCVVSYETAAGGKTEITVLPSETATVLTNAKTEGKYVVVSYFNAGIDEVSKTSAEQTLPPKPLQRTYWEFPGYNANSSDGTRGYDSQEIKEGNVNAPDNGRVMAMLDGDASTFWHSSWEPETPYPHWFIVNLNRKTEIHGVMLQRRQGDTRTSKGYYLYTCESEPTDPDDPVDGYNWEYQGDFPFNPNSDDEQTAWLQQSFPKARYVKIYFDEAKHKGESVFSMFAEFALYGTVLE
ncbi:MAG: discoidin domain-containing protein [Prevotellaceae bacterium]|jgi:hypothetical protein|nr:discoidin domain-containing protein [Prevotellaceae bacterium]